MEEVGGREPSAGRSLPDVDGAAVRDTQRLHHDEVLERGGQRSAGHGSALTAHVDRAAGVVGQDAQGGEVDRDLAVVAGCAAVKRPSWGRLRGPNPVDHLVHLDRDSTRRGREVEVEEVVAVGVPLRGGEVVTVIEVEDGLPRAGAAALHVADVEDVLDVTVDVDLLRSHVDVVEVRLPVGVWSCRGDWPDRAVRHLGARHGNVVVGQGAPRRPAHVDVALDVVQTRGLVPPRRRARTVRVFEVVRPCRVAVDGEAGLWQEAGIGRARARCPGDQPGCP